ncbi:MAG: ABC transporter substrate-binding protein [Pseudomonadota bacterium]
MAMLSAAGVSNLGTGAFALSKGQAESLITTVNADIQRVINSGKSEGSMIRDFERIFAKHADVGVMARSSLGVARRGASSSQLRSYTKAFQGYVARKYGKRFREFAGAEISVLKSQKSKRGYLVSTRVKLRGRSAFAVDWQVSDASGRTRVFDLIIEGISMLRLERQEIGQMLDRRGGDLNKLIAHLKTAS